MRKHSSLLCSCLLLLTCLPGSTNGQSDFELDVRAIAIKMEDSFKACPRREVVAQFEGKHHKPFWQKQAWGPPTEVFADVKSNSESVLYPYLLIVEFSLRHTFGPERQSKEDAQNDSELEAKFGDLLTGRYRNIFLVGKDGIRIRSREFRPMKIDGTVSTWEDRPLWPDACWDQIVK